MSNGIPGMRHQLPTRGGVAEALLSMLAKQIGPMKSTSYGMRLKRRLTHVRARTTGKRFARLAAGGNRCIHQRSEASWATQSE
jgi:hypothetical protein